MTRKLSWNFQDFCLRSWKSPLYSYRAPPPREAVARLAVSDIPAPVDLSAVALLLTEDTAAFAVKMEKMAENREELGVRRTVRVAKPGATRPCHHPP